MIKELILFFFEGKRVNFFEEKERVYWTCASTLKKMIH